MHIRSNSSPASFGDGEVLLHFFEEGASDDSPLVLLFHGVHGSATPAEGNKYGYLARSLARSGCLACVVETGRLRRDKATFGDDRVAWAIAAFQGKTFAMEVYDACSALESAVGEWPGRPVVLWGFSLGGIISVLLAGKEVSGFVRQTGLRAPVIPAVNALVVSGSGDRVRTQASDGLNLPILDTLGSSETVHIAASKASPDFALFFYGGCDETFDEESSRRIFRSLRLDEEDKAFIILPGVDHAFRTQDGVSSLEPLDRMLEITTATLGRYRTTGGCPARPEE